ncbi:metalloprotease TIKI1-like [Garra rufa]|uniref:metalloprotease TIKI1-like n=1 Tax=Garra rufa TaxID=137080 RepID=UPI003CCE8207
MTDCRDGITGWFVSEGLCLDLTGGYHSSSTLLFLHCAQISQINSSVITRTPSVSQKQSLLLSNHAAERGGGDRSAFPSQSHGGSVKRMDRQIEGDTGNPSVSPVLHSSRRSSWRSGELTDEDAPLEPFLHESRDLQEDEDLRLLLPDSLELLEKVEHKLKKKRRNKQKKQRHRQFNDLWVRMEESVTAEAPPPVVRIINGYITVQTHPQEHGRANQHRTFSGSSSSSPALTVTALCVQILLLLL